MKMNKNAFLCPNAVLPAAVCLVFLLRAGFGQATYSYLDENGTRVLTNIAPTKAVSDLKISGMPPAPPTRPSPVAAKKPKPNITGKLSASGTRPASINTRPAPGDSAHPMTASGGFESVSVPSGFMPAGSTSSDLGAIIEKYATQYQLDPNLVKSVIATESGFQRRAVSPKGALGLMQLMPATAARLGVRDPLDPEQNIRGGTKHLRFLMDTFDNKLDLSLAAYNAGENLVLRLGRVPNIPETRDYVRMVTGRYGQTFMAQAFAPEYAAPTYPPVFRYLDRSGILVLTNIPPSGSGGASGQTGSGQRNEPQ
jgi:hypothetical protein